MMASLYSLMVTLRLDPTQQRSWEILKLGLPPIYGVLLPISNPLQEMEKQLGQARAATDADNTLSGMGTHTRSNI